jgi:hypothetical protein
VKIREGHSINLAASKDLRLFPWMNTRNNLASSLIEKKRGGGQGTPSADIIYIYIYIYIYIIISFNQDNF